MIEASSEYTHTARKEHKCSYCHGIIKVGEKYKRAGCVGDGTAWTWKSHLTCESLAFKLVEYHELDDSTITDNDFYYAIYEAYERITGLSATDMKLSDMLEVVKEHHFGREDAQ